MINLLPIAYKRDLLVRYRMRLAIALCVFTSVVSICVTAVFGVFLSIVSEEHAAWSDYVAAVASDPETRHAEEAQVLLDLTQASLTRLSPNAHQLHATAVLNEIMGTKRGVVLLGVNIEEGAKEGRFPVTVHGVADSRASLVEFTRLLEGAGFKDVDVPVGSFVNETNIPFSLAFYYND
jgi:hypothetical protein